LPLASLLIGDRRIDRATGGEYEHIYAATGKPTIGFPLAGAAEIDESVAAARRALPVWRTMPANLRRDLLLRLSERIVRDADRLSMLQTIENGVPRAFCAELPARAADFLAYNAGWTDKIGGAVNPVWPVAALDYSLDEPYGVVGLIVPWNAPLVSVGQVIGPALAASNTVVVKPPELAPFTSIRIGELALEAGLPAGVVNIVPGGPEAGEALVRHAGIDKIHFTGSDATARRVLAAALEHITPVGLELGGKSALLIFPDADLLRAAEQAISAAVVLSGQGCTNCTRVLVHTSIYDRVVSLAKGLLRRVRVGDPMDETTAMGPVISLAACERVLARITEASRLGEGRLIAGGQRLGGELAGGYFISPALFADVDHASRLAQDEIFGPAVSFIKFDSEDEAVTIANQTRYGLAAYVHTADLRRAHRVSQALVAGSIWVNGLDGVAPSAPFGGMKHSGYGRLGGRHGIREFTRSKNVWVAV
jgi:aldehyde dehydrogenase (NAD+)